MSKKFGNPAQVVYVCTGDKCKKRGGKELSKLFNSLAKEHHLKGQVEIVRTDCTDRCKFGPIVCLQPQNMWLTEVHELQAAKVFREHILGQAPAPPASRNSLFAPPDDESGQGPASLI